MRKLPQFILALVVIAVVAYAAYRYYLPSTIAESLKSGQKSSLVPDEIHEKVEAFKSKVATDIGNLPELMVETNIDYDDLKTMLDRLDPGEASDAILAMSSVNITSTEQAFDIVKEHVNIDGYDLETFREMFVRNSDIEEIQKAMKKVRGNEVLVSMGMPVAIEVAKDLLESSRQDIEKQLDSLQSTQ